MNDINFDIPKIAKNVDLNKVVTFDIIDKNKVVTFEIIDKDVDDNLNNREIFSISPVYRLPIMPIIETCECFTWFVKGEVQLEGGTLPFSDTNPGDDFTISFNQAVSPGVDGELPDLDDLNASGVLLALDGIPPGDGTNDTGLPQPNLAITDLSLVNGTFVENVADGALYEYEAQSDYLINFGERFIDRNLNGVEDGGERGNLTLSLPAGDIFEVLFANNGGVEVDFADSNATFTFDPITNTFILCNNATFTVPADMDIIIDSLGSLASYEIEAIAEFPWDIIMAWAESAVGASQGLTGAPMKLIKLASPYQLYH